LSLLYINSLNVHTSLHLYAHYMIIFHFYLFCLYQWIAHIQIHCL